MAVQVPLSGSYSWGGPSTSTLPLASSVAEWPTPPVSRLPVEVQVPLVGSYSSAPPVTSLTSTLPSRSSVAAKPTSWGWMHAPRGRPRPGGRVVQLGRGQVGLTIRAARNEHPAIEESHRGEAGAGRTHGAGGDPDARRRGDGSRRRRHRWLAERRARRHETVLARARTHARCRRRTGDRRQAALDHEEHTTEGDNGDHRRRGKGGPERGPAIPPAEDGPLSGSMRLVEDGVDDPIRQDLHPIRQVGGQERFGIAWLLHAGCSCSTAEVRASASRAARIAAVA